MNITYNGKSVLAIYRNGTAVEQALIAWNWTPTQLYFGGVRGAAYVPDTGEVLGPLGLPALFGENISAVFDEKNGTPTFGPNRIVNGDFSNGTTNWAVNDPNWVTIAVVDGRIRVTALDTLIRWTWQSFPTVIGKTYELSFDYDSGTATGITFSAGSSYGSGDRIATTGRTGAGTAKALILATSTTTWTTYGTSSNNAGKQVFFDNISVREFSGNPSIQTSTSPRPLLGRAPLRGKVNVLASSNPGTAPKNISGTVTPAGIRSATVAESPDGLYGRTQKKLIANAGALVGVNDHTGFSLQTANVASPYTLSFIAKPAELDGLFIRMGNYSTSQVNVSLRLSDGVIYSGGGAFATWGGLVFKSITELSDGFKRYEYTYTIGINQTLTIRGRSVSGLVSENDGVNGVYLDMVQLEAGSTSTAYQEVTTAVDTVEEGVTSFPFIRLDLSDDTLITAGLASTKNLTRFSEEFDNAAWVKQNSNVVQPNVAIAPDGTMSADKLVERAATQQHRIYQGVPSLTVPRVFSVYMKQAERTWAYIEFANGAFAFFNLATGEAGAIGGTGITSNISPAPNGFYRCEIRYSSTAGVECRVAVTTGNSIFSHLGDGTSGIYLWGAQFEAGSVATAYEYGGFKGTSLVAGRNGTAVESVTLPDGNFTLGPTAVTSGTPGLLRAVGDILGYNLINKTLTAKERKYLIQYYKDRGAKGMLVPGPELITNGDFSNGLTGWTVVGGDGLAELGANGVSILRPTGGFDEAISTAASIPTVVGRSYLVQFRITEAINGPARIEVRDNGGGLQTFLSIGVGTHAFVYTEASSGLILQLFNRGAGQTIVFNNISLKELRPEEEWV